MNHSILLCLLCLLAIDSNSVVINCDEKDNSCASSAIVCDERIQPGEDCEVHCDGKDACKDAHITCPSAKGSDCSLFCDSSNGKDPCKDVVLDATASIESNVLLSCMNEGACQNIVVDARTDEIYLNVTATNDYSMSNADIYCPLNASFCGVLCVGSNSCENSKIIGASSSHISLYAEFRGSHAFQNGFVSMPSDSDIHILCDMDEQDKAAACESAVFDGHDTAISSEIEIECIGDDACSKTQIMANDNSQSLYVVGSAGDNVIADSKIYCPSTAINSKLSNKNNCRIRVFGNGTGMLSNTKIYALELFHDLQIECEYGHSVSENCYDTNESPTVFCKPVGHYDECELSLSDDADFDDWTCSNSDQSTCADYTYNSQEQFESTTTEVVQIKGNDKLNKGLNSASYNKGKLAMSCVIVTLCLLGMGLCIFKRDKIRDCMKNERTIVEDGNSTTVFVGGGNSKGKNRYASLEDSNEENDIFSSDQANESIIDTSDSD